MRVPITDLAQTTAHQPTTRVLKNQMVTVTIVIAVFGVAVGLLLPPPPPPPPPLRLKNQTEIHVRGAVTVLRVNVLVNVVAPKENLLGVLHVMGMAIAIHVMQDIT